MNCPYCNKIMDEGYILSYKGDIRWTPKDKKPGATLRFNHPKDYEVMLCKVASFTRPKIKVFRCSHCKIEIIDENNLQ